MHCYHSNYAVAWIVLDSGRTMVCDYYFVQSSDVQETLRVYDTIRDLNTVRFILKIHIAIVAYPCLIN